MEFEIALQYGVGIIALLIILIIKALELGALMMIGYTVYSLFLEDALKLLIENIKGRNRGK